MTTKMPLVSFLFPQFHRPSSDVDNNYAALLTISVVLRIMHCYKSNEPDVVDGSNNTT